MAIASGAEKRRVFSRTSSTTSSGAVLKCSIFLLDLLLLSSNLSPLEATSPEPAPCYSKKTGSPFFHHIAITVSEAVRVKNSLPNAALNAWSTYSRVKIDDLLPQPFGKFQKHWMLIIVCELAECAGNKDRPDTDFVCIELVLRRCECLPHGGPF